jgi:prepilin-type N-terminal cleavage/methylation domain-containing protein
MRRFYRGFTLLELQVTIVIVAVGVIAVSSVLATEQRLLKRLHSGAKPVPTRADV